ncbi:tripartite tricarboxylate transporter TctB family protein [Pseudonocardia nantongensis]|uniref:tripartite tricarboxylate transporter TctB family protein n=1 Tax=Pseudonocardia nantongensis TaxID=1181885 RepID=UPI00397921F1
MSTADQVPDGDTPGAVAPTAAPSAVRRFDPVEVAMSAVLLAVFAVAVLLAAQWSFRAALTPLLAAGTGAVLSGLHLVRSLTGRAGRSRAQRSGEGPPPSDEATRVFATAGRRSWTVALAWVVGFFAGTYVIGLVVTGAVFALAYLRVQARASWPASVGYGVAVGLVVWLLFDVLFEIALPEGLML